MARLLYVCIHLYYPKGFLPEMILYKIAITANTNKMCSRLPVGIPDTIPKNPRIQTTIQITAMSQIRLLIIFCFMVI